MKREPSKTFDEKNLELEKFYIEQAKIRLAKSGWWLDAIGKVGIPASVLVLSLVTYLSGTQMAENRLQFDRDVSQSELMRKDSELFIRNLDSQRNANRLIADFLEKHLRLIVSKDPEDRKRLEQHLQITFEKDEQTVVIARIEHLRASEPRPAPKADDASPQIQQVPAEPAPNYVDRGKADIANRKFVDAAIAFRLHLATNPNDALVWNYLSYAQMRAGQLREARESISMKGKGRMISGRMAARCCASLGRERRLCRLPQPHIHRQPKQHKKNVTS